MRNRRVRAVVVTVAMGAATLATLPAAPGGAQPASPPDRVLGGQAFAGTATGPTEPTPTGAVGDQVPGVGAESVIGTDGRSPVADTTVFPYRAIGQIEFDQDGEVGFICTGWLIDANTVLTAGHCVHNGSRRPVAPYDVRPPVFSTNVVFAPGRDGGSDPYGTCGATELWTTNGWADDNNDEQDYGIIQLDCEIGDTVGWLGYRHLSDGSLLGRSITIAGYPADQAFGTAWEMDDQVRDLVNQSVRYRADTFGGQSGAPVFEDTGCGGPCGLAVHAYGCPGGTPCPAPNNYNSGPRLTSGRVDTIYDKAVENDPHPDLLIRRNTGSFIGNNRVNRSGANQSLNSPNLPAGATRTFVVRIQNDGDDTDTVTVDGDASTPNFTVRYFEGSTNVTADVTAGTYELVDLPAGASSDLRIEVRVKNSAPATALIDLDVRAYAGAAPVYEDHVVTSLSR